MKFFARKGDIWDMKEIVRDYDKLSHFGYIFKYFVDDKVFEFDKDTESPLYVVYFTPWTEEHTTALYLYRFLKEGDIVMEYEIEPCPTPEPNYRKLLHDIHFFFSSSCDLSDVYRVDKSLFDLVVVYYVKNPEGTPTILDVTALWELCVMRACERNPSVFPDGTETVTITTKIKFNPIDPPSDFSDMKKLPPENLLNPYSPILIPVFFRDLVINESNPRFVLSWVIHFGKLADGREIPQHLQTILLNLLEGKDRCLIVKEDKIYQ